MEDYSELSDSYIAKRVIKENDGISIEKMNDLIETEILKNTSHKWFNGKVVIIYPKIKETRSKKRYSTIHGVNIDVNSRYINYQALLVNIDDGNKYVLKKPLRFEIGDDIPICIDDLEELETTTNTDIPYKEVSKTLQKKRITSKKI